MNGEMLLYSLLGLGCLVILIMPAIFVWGYRQNAKRGAVEFIVLADANVTKMANGNLKFGPRRVFNYIIAAPLVFLLVGIAVMSVTEIIQSLQQGRPPLPTTLLLAFGGLILFSSGLAASLIPLLRTRTCIMYPLTQTVRVGWKRYKYEDIQQIVIEGSEGFAKKQKSAKIVYIGLRLSSGESVVLGGFNGFVSQTMKRHVNKVLGLIKEALGEYAGHVTVDNQMW